MKIRRRSTEEEQEEEDPYAALSELKVKSESKYFGLAKCGTLQSVHKQ